MKKIMISILLLAVNYANLNCMASESYSSNTEVSAILLPHNFMVYMKGSTVINHPAIGFESRVLPTINHYAGVDGGYVALYTRQKAGAVYSVGDGIYVVGQIRVQGKYLNRTFYPKGYSKGYNITQDKKILALCHQYFPEFKGKVWIGGDTGGLTIPKTFGL